jgi:glucan phosphoethanolaminetransferase (alkaline phosphatase superfamily)
MGLAQMSEHKSIVVLAFKLLSLCSLLVLAPWGWWDLVFQDVDWMLWFNLWMPIALHLLVFAVSLAGLCVLPFLRDWRIRVPLATVFLAGFAVDQVMLGISGQHMTIETTAMAIRESALASGFFKTFGGTTVRTFLLVLPVALAFFLPPGKAWEIPSRNFILPIGALILVAFLQNFKQGRAEMDGFPSPYSVPAQLLVSQVFSLSSDNIQREPVDYAGDLRPVIKKIVMVVDESVRGDYLGINAPQYDNVPILAKAVGELANYGVAISGTNCSYVSRFWLRVGIRKHQIPNTSGLEERLPTIWQYAKNAEFKTILIDAWKKFGSFHSGMNSQEARQIDEFITILDFPYYMRDLLVADKLVETLKRDEPMFIYVNKWGAHQPYDDNFPPNLSYDPSPLVASLPLSETRRESVREYHKALRWSVNGFFEKVLPVISEDTILIYTSDHGEALYQGGYDTGHCSNTPVPGEVYVPLFAATRSPQLQSILKAEARRAYNSASHFEVFPTLLELMGYSRAWVETKYGPSLLNFSVSEQPSFFIPGSSPAAGWHKLPDQFGGEAPEAERHRLGTPSEIVSKRASGTLTVNANAIP